MKNTGVFATKEDLEKLRSLAQLGWSQGETSQVETMIVLSVGKGIGIDQATIDAKKACHQLALDYGLSEIPGFYGIANNGEFVRF